MRLLRLLKNDLARETTAWVEEGVISVEHAEKICARYGIDYHNQAKRSFGYFVLVTLGYLFVGLAVITMLSHNWEEIPRAVRMGGLILVTLLVNGVAIYQYRRGEGAAAVGAFFLGGLLYGASIMLIAQIYHIGEHFPDGIYWWMAGVLPLALLLQSSLLMILAATLGYLWFFVESFLHFYPATFPILLLLIGWHCLKVKQSNILFLALVIGVGFWFEYSFSWYLGSFRHFEPAVDNCALAAAYFVFLYGLAKWLDARDNPMLADYGALLGLWTLRFAVLTLFILSFEDPWKELLRAGWDAPGLVIALTIVLTLLAIGLTWLSRKEIVTITIVSLLVIGISLVLVNTTDRTWAIVLQVVDNVLLISSGVWLIIRGIQGAITHYYFLGIVIILATGFVRYLDLVGDYVGASMLFALFAVILLSAARYWRSKIKAREVTS